MFHYRSPSQHTLNAYINKLYLSFKCELYKIDIFTKQNMSMCVIGMRSAFQSRIVSV